MQGSAGADSGQMDKSIGKKSINRTNNESSKLVDPLSRQIVKNKSSSNLSVSQQTTDNVRVQEYIEYS